MNPNPNPTLTLTLPRRLAGERRVALRQHLNRLVQMCHSHGLRPMAYSDPLFRLASTSNNYYDEKVAPLGWAEVKELPQGLDLVSRYLTQVKAV